MNNGKLALRVILMLLLLAVVGACNKSSNKSNSAPSNVSGTITAAASSMSDSDVNDTYSPYSSNDDFSRAQLIANPVTLGGYVNQPGSGPAGRSFSTGDIDDYYEADLVSGQVVTLLVADSTKGNLGIYLYASDHTLVDSKTSSSTVTAPATGAYFIRVSAISGASVYNITISSTIAKAVSPTFGAGATSAIVASEFVPGEVIVRFKDLPQGVTINERAYRANAVGMQVKAGAGGREMLMKVGTGAARATTFKALGLQQQLQVLQTADPVLQQKLDTLSVVNALRKRSDVIFATPNYIVHPTQVVPNDKYYSRQWDLVNMNLPQAWDVTTGAGSNGKPVIVAVIDTGVLLNHPDLQGQLVQGFDFISDKTNAADNEATVPSCNCDFDNNPDDPGDGDPTNGVPSSFHGTHVSGTIAAASNNTTGVAGIGWDVKIMPLRALGKKGGTSYDILQALRYAAGLSNDSGTVPAQKADVINMSFGGPIPQNADGSYTTTDPTVTAVRNAGVIMVAAAGNDSSNLYYYPASLDGVVSVSAVDAANNLAPYSNYGSTIDVAAPGGDMTADINGDGVPDGILSTLGDDSSGTIQFAYGYYQGTSMASPHVAGVAALMKAVDPAMTPDAFDTFIKSGSITTDKGTVGRDDKYGYGVIDAYKAVEAAYAAANNGTMPTVPPVAVASPSSLNFSYNLDTMTFALSNGGGGTLKVSNISNDSGGWLTVTPGSTVDANGLGSYTATVNRGGLTTTTNTATITVTTDVNTVSIPVIMQLNNGSFSNSAGHLFGVIFKTDNSNSYTVEIGEPSNGKYTFQFANGTAPVPGDYYLVAGSDTNNDNYICGTGESCGGYPTLGTLSVITVTGDGTAITGKNFGSGFSSFTPATTAAGTVLPITGKGLHIDKSQFAQ